MTDGPGRRRPATAGPTPGAGGWLSLDDDELLFRIESLTEDHHHDDELLSVVRSERHFFVRQEAAKRVRNGERLKAFSSDRHIGQILARQLARANDSGYLRQLVQTSRHIEVRNAAAAQLRLLERGHRRAPEGDAAAD